MNLDILHAEQGTAISLTEYRDAIEGECDRMCLRVGALLLAAKADHPATFRDWVENELPFGLETARRLMAVAHAYATLPKATLDQLPRPLGALYALRKLPERAVDGLVAVGELHPGTTTAEARRIATEALGAEPKRSDRHSKADIAAGVIIDSSPDDLHPMVLRALLKWCAQVGGGLIG